MAQPSRKRKKTSGFSGLELRLAFESLNQFISSASTPAIETNDTDNESSVITFEPDFMEAVSSVVQNMRTKLDEPQVCRIPLTKHNFLIV
jgi:hypothetical protein